MAGAHSADFFPRAGCVLCHDDRRCLNGIRSGEERGDRYSVDQNLVHAFSESTNERW